MERKEEEFFKKLQVIFFSEAEEHFRNLREDLIQLEKADSDREKSEITERLLREAHSLKGAARSVHRKEIEEVCQSLETEFALLKKNEISSVPQWFDQIHGLLKKAESMTAAFSSKQIPLGKISGEQTRVDFSQSFSTQPETIRISAEKLESIFLKSEEMLTVKLSTQYSLSLIEKLEKSLEQTKEDSLDKLLSLIRKEISSLRVKLKQDLMSLNRILEPLFEDARRILISPFSFLLDISIRLFMSFSNLLASGNPSPAP